MVRFCLPPRGLLLREEILHFGAEECFSFRKDKICSLVVQHLKKFAAVGAVLSYKSSTHFWRGFDIQL